jgi:hypothetical protein
VGVVAQVVVERDTSGVGALDTVVGPVNVASAVARR